MSGIAVEPTTSASSGRILKPLSCTTCRARKVKCDKTDPCSACVKSETTCVYPERVRRRKNRNGGLREQNADLLKRLGRLEGLVGKIEKSGGDKKITETSSPGMVQDHATPTDKYLGGEFWTSFSEEVQGLRQMLDQSQEDDEDDDEEGSQQGNKDLRTSSSFVFSPLYANPSDSRILHPPRKHVDILLDIFYSNVDPVFKITHQPTMRREVLATADHLDNIPGGKAMEAMSLAIYFSAVTSLTDDECMTYFGEDSDSLWVKYRFALERALGEADFLNSTELSTLNAFVLYIAAVRVKDKSRHAWSLCSLMLRLAQALGLTVDGRTLNLSPFEIEMRRRTWWGIVTLDIRSSEDRGSQPMVTERLFSTELPVNINDADFGPDSIEIVGVEGGTEMTFSLLSHEVSNLRRNLDALPSSEDLNSTPGKTLDYHQRTEIITQHRRSLEGKYAYGDPNHPVLGPLFLATSIVFRIIMSRIWLSIHYPFQKRYKSTLPPGSVSRTWLLQTAIQNLELEYQLRAHHLLKRWVWWSTTYVQWHALAVALAELCVQTDGPLVERAWPVVDEAYSALGDRVADTRKGQLWRPVTSLYRKAKAARQANIQTAETFARLDIHNSGPPLALDTIPAQSHQYSSSFQTDFGQDIPFDNHIHPHSIVFDPFSTPIPQLNVDMNDMDAMSFDKTGASMLAQVGIDDDWMNSMDWANWNGFVTESQAAIADGGGQLELW